MSELSFLGVRLRELRKERNLSQRDLASRAGVSANAISLIERSEISPSVATLQRLATTLNVKMSYFFEREDAQTNVIYLKAGQRAILSSGGVSIAGLGQRLRAQQVELFFITLAPGVGSGRQPVIHLGQEFVCCLKGQVEYKIDETIYILEEGDLLLFEGELPHHWRNPTPEKTELLLILQAPDESHESIRRHFSSYPSLAYIG
jgi:transcriptional regulator with XRE-family HTH domain